MVALVPVKLAISPVPEAARPIDGKLFDQLYTTFGLTPPEPLKYTVVVGAPLHTVWFTTGSTLNVGFTVMLKLVVVPVQLAPPLVNTGDTVMVAVTGAVVAFVAVKPAILPEPFAANPMDVVLLVQL